MPQNYKLDPSSPTMANIESLPVELLLMIVNEVKADGGLKALRLVNPVFCMLVEPLLFTTVTFDSQGKYKIGTSLDMLKSISNPHSRIAPYVQKLVIRCFDRLFSGDYRHVAEYGFVDVHQIQQEFDTYLHSAVRCLPRLASIRVSSGSASLSPTELWTALRTEKVHLKEITIWSRMEPSFLEYLDSFSGIEELSIRRAWASPEMHADRDIADRLTSIIPKHKDTLRKLAVTAAEEGPWSFGIRNAGGYAQCSKLQSLEVSMNCDDIMINDPHDSLAASLGVASQLPELTSLCLCTADSRNWGGSWGWMSQQHEPLTITLMVNGIVHFLLPDDFRREIAVEIDGQVYKVGDEEASRPSHYSPTLDVEEVRRRQWEKHRSCF
ncbi:hypothetical protein VNI00_013072 [Paramarasmius palmivorus]|uniref:F-box domain-containing protein n=1 Tax=Paramarasmius palmivorus TaxID=297713 RepID=A0AAW0BZL8_9AGAR